uniref:Uncharacterized protein n=1 Tax=Oryza meridionalis TaxID=40149 RepID=A0A0E0EJ95_9ORYZ
MPIAHFPCSISPLPARAFSAAAGEQEAKEEEEEEKKGAIFLGLLLLPCATRSTRILHAHAGRFPLGSANRTQRALAEARWKLR